MLSPLSNRINQVSSFRLSGRSARRCCTRACLIPAHMLTPCKTGHLPVSHLIYNFLSRHLSKLNSTANHDTTQT